MRILGIDPGYAIVGYGLIHYENGNCQNIGYGAITTDSNMDFNMRLEYIYDRMTLLLSKSRPDAISIERLYFQNNQKTAIGVAEARGVILLAGMKAGVEIFEYTPLQVKVSITGYGKAEKPQMMASIQRLLGLKEIPRPDDAADALGLAICHGRMGSTKLKRDMIHRRHKSGF